LDYCNNVFAGFDNQLRAEDAGDTETPLLASSRRACMRFNQFPIVNLATVMSGRRCLRVAAAAAAAAVINGVG